VTGAQGVGGSPKPSQVIRCPAVSWTTCSRSREDAVHGVPQRHHAGPPRSVRARLDRADQVRRDALRRHQERHRIRLDRRAEPVRGPAAAVGAFFEGLVPAADQVPGDGRELETDRLRQIGRGRRAPRDRPQTRPAAGPRACGRWISGLPPSSRSGPLRWLSSAASTCMVPSIIAFTVGEPCRFQALSRKIRNSRSFNGSKNSWSASGPATPLGCWIHCSNTRTCVQNICAVLIPGSQKETPSTYPVMPMRERCQNAVGSPSSRYP